MNTVGIIIFGLLFVFVIWLVVAAYRNRYNISTFTAGVTYDLMSHEQKGATDAVVEYRAAKKLEEQRSDEGDDVQVQGSRFEVSPKRTLNLEP